MSRVPAWLRDLLKGARGRDVSLGKCPACGSSLLVGADEDFMAFTARAEPEPVTALGEVLALLAGARSYELRARPSGRLALTYRDARAIKARPAGSVAKYGGRFDVVTEHACNSPPLPTLPSVHKPTPRDRTYDNEQPPF